jgi:uncharacterized protein (TIGR02300 family)
MRTSQRNLGTRRVCRSCGTKFYDLNKPEPSCPRCGAPAGDDDGDPRAVAMARIKAEGPRKRSKDEEDLPFGLGEEPDSATDDDDEEMDELGELTEESGDDYDEDFE